MPNASTAQPVTGIAPLAVVPGGRFARGVSNTPKGDHVSFGPKTRRNTVNPVVDTGAIDDVSLTKLLYVPGVNCAACAGSTATVSCAGVAPLDGVTTAHGLSATAV